MLSTAAAFLLPLSGALAAPAVFQQERGFIGKERAACADVHVFGARETTASAGFGSSGTVVNLILGAHSGATSEAIDYPAASDPYSASVQQGVTAVTNQVSAYAASCPDAQIVLVGYSQVSKIFSGVS